MILSRVSVISGWSRKVTGDSLVEENSFRDKSWKTRVGRQELEDKSWKTRVGRQGAGDRKRSIKNECVGI